MFFGFWSHKGLRWIGPLLMIAMGLACLGLAFVSPFYLGLTGLALVGVAACLVDGWMARGGVGWQFKPVRFVRYFLMMNLALLLGMVRFLKGGENSVWEPTKRVVKKPSLTRKRSSSKTVS